MGELREYLKASITPKQEQETHIEREKPTRVKM